MEEQGLFTVVLLSYRSDDYILCAVDSVLAQTDPAVELIVIDDGSPDFSPEEIAAYIEEHRGENVRRVLVLQNPENLGTVRSANRALEQVRGAYVKFLAADDALYDSTVLSRARAYLSAGCDMLVGRVMRCGPDLSPAGPFRDGFARSLPGRSSREVWRRLCIHNEIAAPGVFLTREFFRRYGLFDERYRLLEDWPAWLRAARQGAGFLYGDFYAAKYRTNTGSATGLNRDYIEDREKTFQYEIRPYRRELGPIRYLYAWLTLHVRNSALIRKVYGRLFR
ncbi:MAG: glycosyltransferase [Oscillibacter sp.]|jgi:glycosyltransferase involved in cell wall biosynthesis|nr:glycosyltransferase [uncultured Oscillibacter sp.]MCI8812196.1 glycosyltransferase [Oscillibacter sp.]